MLGSDFVVAGGGIVGLATAYHLSKKGFVVLLEKEKKICTHQSGRNSGVMHSGIYYKPGSFKATNCRKGKRALEAFCDEKKIPFERCGKLIVATTPDEDERLCNLLQKGRDNSINCRILSRKELLRVEPNAEGAISAIHIPETGIVSYKAVCDELAKEIIKNGGLIKTVSNVSKVAVYDGDTFVYTSDHMTYHGKRFFNCAGLYSDRIAQLSGLVPPAKIIPFRGEYYTLSSSASGLVNGLIYPVPDPQFPFLGVHFTKMINGGVECGPNAVLALGRESYSKLQVNVRDIVDIFGYSGFRKMALKHWRTGIGEMMRSFSKNRYLASLRRMVPKVNRDDLEFRPAGIRAQAVLPNGNLVDDFLIEKQKSAIHVLNAPSPAATACLTIGEHIASMV
jgi:L-2-hydroxyglutarate oxidase